MSVTFEPATWTSPLKFETVPPVYSTVPPKLLPPKSTAPPAPTRMVAPPAGTLPERSREDWTVSVPV